MSPIDASAHELRRRLIAGEITSEQSVRSYLDKISSFDPAIGAFLDTAGEAAIQRAKQIDQRRSRGEPLGLLAGIPVAMKDVICTKGWRTTCASRMLSEFIPPYDATVIAKLSAADAILIGKTNMDEFAMGGSTENSAFQLTRNPWDVERTPGGSSGGSAACVACDMAPLSIGTDTGGSIRQPAAFCSVTGLKPSYGRVSRFGLVAFASSLDQIGPLGTSVPDVALLLQAIAGHDPRDSTSANLPVPSYSETVNKPISGLRVGVVREHFGDGVNPEISTAVLAAIDVFRSFGASITDVSLPHGKYGVATYYIIAPCEASSNLARYDGVHYGYRCDEKTMLEELEFERRSVSSSPLSATVARTSSQLDSPLVRLYRQTRAEGFGPEVKRRIMLGTYALSAGYYDAYYLKALKVRRLIRRDFDQAFQEVDVILGPTTPHPPFRIGEKANDPLAMYLEDLFTVPANLAGIPGISVPCGFTGSGLPIGLQLQSSAFSEETLLRAAQMFQSVTDWHRRRPTLLPQTPKQAEGYT